MLLIFFGILYCVWWSSPVLSINSIVLDAGLPIVTGKKNNCYISHGKEIDQKLNHFDLTDDRTFKQKYYSCTGTSKPENRIFLFIGGKESSDQWFYNGTWIQFANEWNYTHYYYLEHRFYGESHPTKNMSTENLVYLTRDQALADIANFIKLKKDDYFFKDEPWIVFGGSYAGSLAVQMRIKYPHLVHAAVSSSGPLWAKKEFNEYFVAIEKSLASYNPECVSQIKSANKMMNKLLTTDDGAYKLTKRFKLCNPLDRNNKKDVSYLFLSLASRIAGVVQYNKINRSYGNTDRHLVTIKSICDIMVDKSIPSELNRYAAVVNNLLYVDDTNFGCTPSYEQMVQYYKDESWESKSAKYGARQWKYQICTELGLFQTSGESTDFVGFNITLQYYTEMCSDIFGKTYNPLLLSKALDEESTTINSYKEINLRSERIIFVRGSLDPWQKLGITQSTMKNTLSVFINGTSHCADMYPPSSEDNVQLKEGREKIKTTLKSFVSQSDFN